MPDGYLNDEVGRGEVKKEGGRMCVEGPWERKKVSLNGSRRGEVQRHLGGRVDWARTAVRRKLVTTSEPAESQKLMETARRRGPLA